VSQQVNLGLTSEQRRPRLQRSRVWIDDAGKCDVRADLLDLDDRFVTRVGTRNDHDEAPFDLGDPVTLIPDGLDSHLPPLSFLNGRSGLLGLHVASLTGRLLGAACRVRLQRSVEDGNAIRRTLGDRGMLNLIRWDLENESPVLLVECACKYERRESGISTI